MNGINTTNVSVRADGRPLCNKDLMQLKMPSKSRGWFDAHHRLATRSGERAFRPRSGGGYKLAA